MANTKGVANFKSVAYSGKQSLLPPKSPFPSMAPAYADHGSNPSPQSRGILKPKEGNKQHQRTSSESFLVEEQPSWLDDLLNEPETPVRRGAHRRSSSDSFAYLDVSNIACNIDNVALEELKHRNLVPRPSWGSQEFDHKTEMQYSAYYPQRNSFGRIQIRGWHPNMNVMAYPNKLASTRDKVAYLQAGPGSTDGIRELDSETSREADKKDPEESMPQDSERIEASHANLLQPEVDPKRAKQKFAQRSRVRKLQYIAELERNIQALQAEISEVSAEMEFLDQQNLILNLENKALKQRVDGIAQEQLIKSFQQEMLEREVSRLCSLHQQQQQKPQQLTPIHGRSSSRDLDSQFASLSLKHTWKVLDGTQ